MRIIPIHLPPLELRIHADRRLAFQVITAFGAAAPGTDAASRVLSREDGRLLVEFHTPGRDLLGRRKTYRTVEWVALCEPERIDFETVEGPVAMMQDRFVLQAEGGCTRLRYESEFGLRGWVIGWLLGALIVRPTLKRLMREHMAEMKETIEARARKSRVFPQRPCGAEDDDQEGA